ncbi:MazG-like family protein [Streptomyces sp. NPDC006193]|uniref:MazG-like family protein n=1 Tax=Streptomyces sp. NPDC006193 TaxID=3155717 RepID=UPI0033B3528D
MIRRLADTFSGHDTGNGLRPGEQWTLQVLKLTEEVGEAAQAVIGARGSNPRKGHSHTWEDVQDEVADVVITGMVALARMRPDAREHLIGLLARKAERFLCGQDSTEEALHRPVSQDRPSPDFL